MSPADAQDPASDGRAGRRPRWLRWGNVLYVLLAAGLGLGVFGVIVGAFWLVTAAAYLLALAFFGFAARAVRDAIAQPVRIAADDAGPDRV